MTSEILRLWLPICISLLSLLLSGVAIGWNVYRDIILKARVRVRFAIVSLVALGKRISGSPRYLRVDVTNHGPGPVTIQMIAGKLSPFWKRMLRRPQHFVILNDYSNPLNPRLPHRLEIGDSTALLLPYDKGCFLKDGATHIGVTDSFGRVHYARAGEVKAATQQYRIDFPTRGDVRLES